MSVTECPLPVRWISCTASNCQSTVKALVLSVSRVGAVMLTAAFTCREQTIYKVSAIAASAAVIALAVGAVHYRFMWHMKHGHDFPTAEALATFCLTIGGIVSDFRTGLYDCVCDCLA